jgi:hypothetical protein
MEEAQRLFKEAPTTMVITHEDPKLVLVLDDGRQRNLYTDNRKETEGVGEVRTKWDHERIVTATKFGERVKALETYQLAADRRQLLVNVKMEMSMMGQTRAVEVRRVYDPPPN